MNLSELCREADIFCPPEAEELEILGIETDSGRVKTGSMFVCIRGLRTDGHAYIEEAIERGAVCIVVDRYAVLPTDTRAVYLQCGDARRTTAYLYNAWYRNPTKGMKLIGVTGTNGKTSVSHMLCAILEASLHRTGLIGTVGCKIGDRKVEISSADPAASMTTPDPEVLYRLLYEMAKEGVEYVVMEVSSHALTLEKVAPLSFECAVFTNLTPEHLDFHKTMENYARAKAKLMAASRICVINADSPYAALMQKSAAGRYVTCTQTGKDADFTATDVETDSPLGTEYRLCSIGARLRLSCKIPGSFTVMNSMQAAIAALSLGCAPSTVKGVLASIGAVKGRMEYVKLGIGADFSVLLDYAHTPDALEKLLLCARSMRREGGRVVVVFGCGGDRDKTKRAIMGEIATRLADAVIITSDNPRSEDPLSIIDEILLGVSTDCAYQVIPNREEAIRFAVLSAQKKDLILLAGKGHEEYEITRTGKRAFDERKIVKEAYLERVRIMEGGLHDGKDECDA